MGISPTGPRALSFATSSVKSSTSQEADPLGQKLESSIPSRLSPGDQCLLARCYIPKGSHHLLKQHWQLQNKGSNSWAYEGHFTFT